MDNPRKVVMAYLTPEFVEAMEHLFPITLPQPGTPTDRLWFDHGQASVPIFLRNLLDEATQNILETTHVS